MQITYSFIARLVMAICPPSGEDRSGKVDSLFPISHFLSFDGEGQPLFIMRLQIKILLECTERPFVLATINSPKTIIILCHRIMCVRGHVTLDHNNES